MAERLRRGQIRLVRMPGPDKARPALVLTRDVMLDHLSRVTVAPITSTIREATSEVVLGIADGMKGPCAVNLFNCVTVHRSSIGRTLATLRSERMREVCAALAFALGCDA